MRLCVCVCLCHQRQMLGTQIRSGWVCNPGVTENSADL